VPDTIIARQKADRKLLEKLNADMMEDPISMASTRLTFVDMASLIMITTLLSAAFPASHTTAFWSQKGMGYSQLNHV
jgi:hypothetical protein